jgi:hypothetical protein
MSASGIDFPGQVKRLCFPEQIITNGLRFGAYRFWSQ